MLQVHDSLDWFRAPDREDVGQEARRIMGDMSTIDRRLHDKIPMVVDSNSAQSWGHASFPKQDWSIYDEEVSGSELSDTTEE